MKKFSEILDHCLLAGYGNPSGEPWTAEKIHERFGLATPNMVSRYRTGHAVPEAATFKKICQTFLKPVDGAVTEDQRQAVAELDKAWQAEKLEKRLKRRRKRNRPTDTPPVDGTPPENGSVPEAPVRRGRVQVIGILVLCLGVLIFSKEISDGIAFITQQVLPNGRLDPFAFFVWALLLSSILFFALGFEGDGAQNRGCWIENGAWRDTYTKIVTRTLDQIDGFLLSKQRDKRLKPTSFTRNWSIELYEKTLALAILYPIFLLMVQWLITGAEQSLGFFRAWPADDTLWRRLLICFCFVGSVSLAFVARCQPQRWSRIGLGCLAIAVNFFGYAMCWNAHGGVDAGPGAVNMATVAFIFGIAFRLFDNIAVPIAAASTAGATLSFVFLPLVDLAELLTGRVGAGYPDDTVRAVHTALNHSFNLFLFFSLLRIFSRFADSRAIQENPAFATIVYIIVSVGTAMLMFFASSQRFWSEYYLFLGLIPILNAFFDFLSIGLTRYTLRIGVSKFGLITLVFAAIDVVIALLLFVLLVFCGLFVLELVNLVAGSIVVPVRGSELICRIDGSFYSAAHLAAGDRALAINSGDCAKPLLSQMQDEPIQHVWLILIFASTLLPTLCHILFALLAFAPAMMGASLRSMIARLSRAAKTDLLARAGAALAFGLWISVSLMVIAVILHAFALAMFVGTEIIRILAYTLQVLLS